MQKYFFPLGFAFLILPFLFSCQEKDPSIAKIFVRNNNNILVEDVDVMLVAEPSATPVFNETARTGQAGYAVFNLDPVFDQFTRKEKKERMGEFKIYLPSDTGIVKMGEITSRPHITAVKTIFLPD